MGKWKDAWLALIQYVHKVDRLCHLEGLYEDKEPPPKAALMDIFPSTRNQDHIP